MDCAGAFSALATVCPSQRLDPLPLAGQLSNRIACGVPGANQHPLALCIPRYDAALLFRAGLFRVRQRMDRGVCQGSLTG